MELTERKLRILQAIISDYVKTAEPVGSRTISKKYDLGISPATIRNEMADLEEMGYLTHPHTSAGRVPSDMAYRLYVNALMEKKELSREEKNVIAERLQSGTGNAALTRDIVFVGLNRYIEIWDAEVYAQMEAQTEMDFEDISDYVYQKYSL